MSTILVVLLVTFLGTSIWAIIDATSRPPEAFVAVGDSKTLWITLIAVFTLALGIVGFILSLVYLFSIRPKVSNWSGDTSMTPPPAASRRPWVYFVIWMLVGASYAMIIVGALSIGIFFVPIAVIATVFLVRKPSAKRGIPGLFGGLALPLFYVAYLNRSGPGTICTQIQSSLGVGQSCTQEWNPWSWLAAGLALLGVGTGIFIVASRSGKERRCSACSQMLGHDDQFCPSCGSRTGKFNAAL